MSEHQIKVGPFVKAVHPLRVHKADIKERAQERSVIQLKETYFGVWFSAVKGISVISRHSPTAHHCTDYHHHNREDLEWRPVRPHYQYLTISLITAHNLMGACGMSHMALKQKLVWGGGQCDK